METLKYKIIKDAEQYQQYCSALENLLENVDQRSISDEIELLTFLIEKYDSEVNTFEEFDPVTLLSALMKENHLRSKDLVDLLNVSKGYVSDILHYKKGMSKEVIRKLADHFKVNQKAFNRPYPLILANKLPLPHKRSSVNA